MTGWEVTNTEEGSLREAGDIIAVLEAVNKTIDPDQPMYWIAPAPYLGNKVRICSTFPEFISDKQEIPST